MTKLKINSQPTILENKDFKTIIIKVIFFFNEKKDDLAKVQMLPSLITRMNSKYPSEELLQLEKKKLYILGCNCTTNVIGTLGYFSFNLVIPDVEALGRDILEEQFEFFRDFIYSPMIDDEGFLQEEFEREKKNIRLGMDNALKRMKSYQNIKIRKLVDDVGILSRDLIHDKKLLDELSSKSLYSFYTDIIKNGEPAIYVMGNVNGPDIISLCNKYLYRKKFDDKIINAHLNYYLKPRNNVLEVVEESNFKDSAFSLVYKVKDMKKEDVVLLNALGDLLTSLSSRLLSKKLRDENDLIYSSKVLSYPHYGIFEITVFINKKNISVVREKLEELVGVFKDKEVISESLKNIKERKRLNLIRQLDDKHFLLDDFLFNDIGIDITYEAYFKKFMKLTFEDISNFSDRLVLDTIYFLKDGE